MSTTKSQPVVSLKEARKAQKKARKLHGRITLENSPMANPAEDDAEALRRLPRII